MKIIFTLSSLLLSSCIAVSMIPTGNEPLEVALEHGQTRTQILDCLGQPDALMKTEIAKNETREVWMYGLTKEQLDHLQTSHGRYAGEAHEKNACRMDVIWGTVFAEKYLMHSKGRGLLGDHACYSKLRKCTP